MTLYLDVIWLLNWFFDCLLLYWTAVLLKRRIPFWRVLAGGFLGSLIIVLSFTSYHVFADRVLVKLLFSIFMILTVYGFGRFKVFVKNLATLYFVTFLSGGILLGLHYLFEYNVLSGQNTMSKGINQFGDPVSWIFVIIGFPLAWQFSRRTLESIEMTKINHQQLVKVTVKIDDFICSVEGFIDSGNHLYDPISQSPVMILSLNGRENTIPKDMVALFENPDILLNEVGSTHYTWAERLRIIPSKVVGNDHQLLTAIKSDWIEIIQNKDIFRVKTGLVSFTFQKLSADGKFECIVHPKMVTGIPAQAVS
ncbi:sigma-E processing peptidase SpoIIGA [Peribacillus loiseleuriae]|uniref:sigma-E processing peptidase SpoIIGA n=1 Tax=Peribacillus loiseleuriae TaxID=1679170 RepID=UPI00380737DC